ncbi:hypothetical protein ACHQM5_012711 [Ranunculus cassubicifolius]
MRKTARLVKRGVSLTLPEEILIEIMSRLPVKSLGRLMCVSKYWLRLICSPHFTKQQLHHASSRLIFTVALDTRINLVSLAYSRSNAVTDYKVLVSSGLKLVGSCNGLVCLSDYKRHVVLRNPVTKQTTDIRFGCYDNSKQIYDLGFGYDSLTDAYKVVRLELSFGKLIDVNLFRKECYEFYVFTVGTEKWRKIETPFCLHENSRFTPYVNGSLHWFNLDDKEGNLENDFIISFNVGTEEFHKVPLKVRSKGDAMSLGVLQECLCVYDYFAYDKGFFDIWLMKEYGVQDSWTKLYSVPFPVDGSAYLEPFAVQRNGEVLVKDDFKSSLYRYNSKIGCVKEFFHGTIDWIMAVTYVESLVTLPSFIRDRAKGNETT